MLAPLTEEDDVSDEVQRRRREDAVRRAQLYGISSKKRLPSVLTAPHDARTRRELQILVAPEQLILHDGLSVHEDELEQRKHADHLGIRPALDQSQPLRDLYTTIPKQIHLNEHGLPHSTAKHTREWRVGYKNDPQSDFHGAAMRGVFEPTDSVRERILLADGYKQTSTALAYPTPFTTPNQVAEQLQPIDEDKARKEMEAKLRAGMVSDALSSPGKSIKKKHWSPASHATLGLHNAAAKRKQKQIAAAKSSAMKIGQGFPVRRVDSPLKKVDLETEAIYLQRRQAIAQQLNESYAQLQQQAKQRHDPTVRYSLPIENPKFERAYRLGLHPVASSPGVSQHEKTTQSPEDEATDADEHQQTASTKTPKKSKGKKPMLFRPKSAVSLRMDTTLGPAPLLSRSSSSASLLSKANTPGKVAGAKRRPHSATLNYLSNSTVYLMESQAGSGDNNNSTTASETVVKQNAHEILKEQKKYGAQFLGILLQERAKRQETTKQKLQELARRGVLHTIPLPQIFARLRREAMKNIVKRVEHARYEKLPLEEYMSLCGMAVVAGTPSKQRHEELRVGDERGPTSDDEDEDGELIARSVDKRADDDDEPAVIQALRDQAELRNLPFDDPPVNSLVFRKRKSIRPDPANGNNSSTVQAMRKALFVTREQLHIALEAFALPTKDVNMLFSALDVHVEDNVAVWEIICAVEWLQDGHEELRRSRVQVNARHLPKDLEPLRQSVSIPHTNHVPIPLW